MRIILKSLFVCCLFYTFSASAGGVIVNSGSVVLCNVSGVSINNSAPYFSGTAELQSLINPNAPLMTGQVDFINNVSSLLSTIGMWNSAITTLSMLTQSETFGGGYKLTFCYLGPLEYRSKAASPDLSQGIYQLNLQLSTTQTQYAQKANLQYSARSICDLRNSGVEKKARQKNELSPAMGLETDAIRNSTQIPVSSSQSMIETTLNENVTQVPRFCTIEILLQEFSTGMRTNFLSLGDISIQLDVNKQ